MNGPDISSPSPNGPAHPLAIVPVSNYRPKGKIICLPKPVRDRINQLLLDGLTYTAILKNLGEEGKGLNISNLFRYHKGPYRQWLREQHRLADARAKQETAAELFRDIDATGVNQAAIQTTILQIYDAVRDFSSGELKEMLMHDPRFYSRVVNSLSRLSKENLSLQKYRDVCAKAVAVELKQLNIDRELSDNEYQLLVNRMDKVFKVARRAPAPNPCEGGPAAPKSDEGGLAAPKPCEAGPANPLAQMPPSPTH